MSVQTSIDRLNTIKARIRTNLVAQGITVPEDSVLVEMAEMILSVAGEDGRGIVSVTRTSGTGAAGTTDTYTITYTDDTKSTFNVYNGANGSNYILTDDDINSIAQKAANKVDVSGKVNRSGDTMTGALVGQANNNYTEPQFRNEIYLPEGSDMPSISVGEKCWFYEV